MLVFDLPIAPSMLRSRCSKIGEMAEGVRADLYRMRMHRMTAAADNITLAIETASVDIHDTSELGYLPMSIIPYRAPIIEMDYS